METSYFVISVRKDSITSNALVRACENGDSVSMQSMHICVVAANALSYSATISTCESTITLHVFLKAWEKWDLGHMIIFATVSVCEKTSTFRVFLKACEKGDPGHIIICATISACENTSTFLGFCKAWEKGFLGRIFIICMTCVFIKA